MAWKTRRLRLDTDTPLADYLADPVGVLLAHRKKLARLSWKTLVLLGIGLFTLAICLLNDLSLITTALMVAVCGSLIVSEVFNRLSLRRIDESIRVMALFATRLLRKLEEDGEIERQFAENPLN